MSLKDERGYNFTTPNLNYISTLKGLSHNPLKSKYQLNLIN